MNSVSAVCSFTHSQATSSVSASAAVCCSPVSVSSSRSSSRRRKATARPTTTASTPTSPEPLLESCHTLSVMHCVSTSAPRPSVFVSTENRLYCCTYMYVYIHVYTLYTVTENSALRCSCLVLWFVYRKV